MSAAVSMSGISLEGNPARLARPHPPGAIPSPRPTDRRIVLLAAAGWSDTEIADDIGLSARQVNRIIAGRPHIPAYRPAKES